MHGKGRLHCLDTMLMSIGTREVSGFREVATLWPILISSWTTLYSICLILQL